MADLKCTKCGVEASFADASIKDSKKTCGSDGRAREVEVEDVYGETQHRNTYPGETHDWERI